jgi:Ca-activated chloride channel family protein
MQRTAVVYGLALTTLVAAFFLVPRMKAAEPVHVPAVREAGDTPVTELVYSDGTLQVTARLDRGMYLPSQPETVWMDVAVSANGVQTHAPLTTILVVDRSGSMAGEKIEAARAAAARFVHKLADGDALGIVSFGSDVTVDLPVTVLDRSARKDALAVIEKLQEGGGTNIDGGLAAARAELTRVDLAGRVGRVVLVSDGRPTEGDRTTEGLVAHVKQLHDAHVAVSTLGLGLDYNEDLMEQLAVEGHGRYHYLKKGDQLPQILDDELKHASAITATGVKIYLPATLGGLTVTGAPGALFEQGADRVSVEIGDLAAGEERHVLVQLTEGMGTVEPFLAPEVVYRKAGSSADALLTHRADPFRMRVAKDIGDVEQSRRDDVRVRVLQVQASLTMTESMQAYASGDANGAAERLATKKAELNDIAARTKSSVLADEAQNLDRVLQSVKRAPQASSAAAQDMIKGQKARAFDARR